MPSSGSTLEVRAVTMYWPKVDAPVLRDVSLHVRRGEFVAILGANGSGKTTLLKSIVGLVAPSSGSILVDGEEMMNVRGSKLELVRRRIAMISQQANLVKRRSVLANVAMGSLGRHRDVWTSLGALPRTELAHARTCLTSVALEHLAERRAGSVSGGEAQRVAIARALAQRPQVLLADEPVASLDPEAAVEIMRMLARSARADELAVVCTLHQPDLGLGYADRVVGLRAGRIAFDVPGNDVSQAMLDALYSSDAAA